jgi:hypothetical protein
MGKVIINENGTFKIWLAYAQSAVYHRSVHMPLQLELLNASDARMVLTTLQFALTHKL